MWWLTVYLRVKYCSVEIKQVYVNLQKVVFEKHNTRLTRPRFLLSDGSIPNAEQHYKQTLVLCY